MTLTKALIAATLSAGALAVSNVNASAAIACSGSVCWHITERYEFPRSAKIVVHEDNWRPRGHVEFREHEGRGYWRGKEWRNW